MGNLWNLGKSKNNWGGRLIGLKEASDEKTRQDAKWFDKLSNFLQNGHSPTVFDISAISLDSFGDPLLLAKWKFQKNRINFF